MLEQEKYYGKKFRMERLHQVKHPFIVCLSFFYISSNDKTVPFKDTPSTAISEIMPVVVGVETP